MDDHRKLQTVPIDKALDQRLRDAVGSLKMRLGAMTAEQRKWLGTSAVLALLTVAGVLWYAMRTDWRTLFAGLDAQDAREMATQLTAAGIRFDVSADGATLRVPVEALNKARLATTAKGGPRSGRMGFELFDKPNWIGSEFDERVNYQRALEGELEHTIGSMTSIASARVHLALPHESLFTDQQRGAKASVVLKLRRRSLGEEEAEGIRNLVASAVEDLSADNVVLVDADGHGALGTRSANAVSESYEQGLTAKLVETLEAVAGPGNVRASVNVDYDSSSSDEMDETYDPNAVVTTSMQRADQTNGSQPVAAGVPGTASNAPNTQPPLFPSQQAGTQNQKQESATYAASKRVRHVVQGAGKVRRVTASLLINDRFIPAAGKGQPASWKARTPEEMKRITELAQTAIGFDTARGDQISVENMTFESNTGAPEPLLAERIWKNAAESAALIKYATILLSMAMLIFLVLRPMTRRAAQPPAGRMQAAPATAALPAQQAPALPVQQQPAPRQLGAQVLYENVAEQMRREPVQSSRLLQSWIHAE